MRRLLPLLGAGLLTVAAMTGCVPNAPATSRPPAESAPAPPGSAATEAPQPTVTLIAIIDGDTIETSAGTVRIIGIDTPERGECGHEEASRALGRLVAPGDPIVLELPAGQNDTDRYDRLLRYVRTSSGIDLGIAQLTAGNAVARYDSRDGYPAHPSEIDYHAAQLATLAADGSVVTTACAGAAPPAAVVPPEDAWWTQYSSCTKLKQNTLGHPTGPFDRDDPEQAEIYNWFAHGTGNNGDGDGDGLACEGGRR
ncbi:MAG TPA: thermonuclease family protein [Microbacteriaceae bacterium]|nr:thermonuclease family protein [Microbacteriaceae bacterium]